MYIYAPEIYGYVCAVACVGFAAGPQLRYTAFRWASTDLNVFLQLTHNSVQRPHSAGSYYSMQ